MVNQQYASQSSCICSPVSFMLFELNLHGFRVICVICVISGYLPKWSLFFSFKTAHGYVDWLCMVFNWNQKLRNYISLISSLELRLETREKKLKHPNNVRNIITVTDSTVLCLFIKNAQTGDFFCRCRWCRFIFSVRQWTIIANPRFKSWSNASCKHSFYVCLST